MEVIRLGAEYSYSVNYVTDKNIVQFFSSYGDSFKAFFYFYNDAFIWHRPNTSMLRFTYDPISGKKIDWDKVYEEHKKSFREYSIELEEELKNELNK